MGVSLSLTVDTIIGETKLTVQNNTFVIVSVKTRLVRTSMHFEKNEILKIGEITHAKRKFYTSLIKPLLRERRLKSSQHIYHLIRLLMGSFKIFV